MIVVYRYKWVGDFTAEGIGSNIPPEVPPDPALVITVAVGPLSIADISIDTGTGPLDPNTLTDLSDYLKPRGWEYVETDPTTPLCPIEAFFPPEYNSDKGDYATHYIASGGASFFSFRVPADFKTLLKLVMVAIPNNTQNNGPFALSSQYGAVGEQSDAHSETDPGGTVSTIANETFELDISSVFSALSAGDACGLDLNQNGITGGVHYLGVLLQYSNT